MTEDVLEARVGAIERALTDGHELGDLPDGAALAARVAALEDRATEIEARLDELEAASLAVRGYVGNIRAVNRDVERRADAALAAVERLTADDAPLRAPNGEPVTASPDDQSATARDAETPARTDRSPGAADVAPTDGSGDSREADDRASPVPERILSRVRGSL